MSRTLALIFDFDDTLAPDSTTGFLKSKGVDTKTFWQSEIQGLMDQGWDPVPAYFAGMIQKSRQSGQPWTREDFKAYAQGLKFHEGVTRLFPHLKDHMAAHHADIGVEFYRISSGIGDILRNTKIAKHFTRIWASEFSYDQGGGHRLPPADREFHR